MNMTPDQAGLVLLTIGHSNHEIAVFLRLLTRHGVTAIVDVRSQPYSAFNPQYNREPLEQALRHHGVRYLFMGEELGARRSERQCYVAGKARYDLIARAPLFLSGLDHLRKHCRRDRVALMCAEKDPIECHRMILVCRHLRSEPFQIRHVLEDGSLETHSASESRLLDLLHLPSGDLFSSREDMIERAYDLQADRIAFEERAGELPASRAR
jgi:uncharacterized protein (DUF488 family)